VALHAQRALEGLLKQYGLLLISVWLTTPQTLNFRGRSPRKLGVPKRVSTTILCRWRRALKPPRHTLLGCPARGSGQGSTLKVEWGPRLSAQARPFEIQQELHQRIY
jgi:hypothetical protein